MENGAYTCFPKKKSFEYVVAWNSKTKPFIMDTMGTKDTYHTAINFRDYYKLDTNCTATLEEALNWVSELENNRKQIFEKGILEDK